MVYVPECCIYTCINIFDIFLHICCTCLVQFLYRLGACFINVATFVLHFYITSTAVAPLRSGLISLLGRPLNAYKAQHKQQPIGNTKTKVTRNPI